LQQVTGSGFKYAIMAMCGKGEGSGDGWERGGNISKSEKKSKNKKIKWKRGGNISHKSSTH